MYFWTYFIIFFEKIKNNCKKELYTTGRPKSAKRRTRKALIWYILWCELVKNFKKQKSGLFYHILSKLLMPKISNLSKLKFPKTLFIDFDAWGIYMPKRQVSKRQCQNTSDKTPSVKTPVSKRPVSKCPVSKRPVSKCQCQNAQCQNAHVKKHIQSLHNYLYQTIGV